MEMMALVLLWILKGFFLLALLIIAVSIGIMIRWRVRRKRQRRELETAMKLNSLRRKHESDDALGALHREIRNRKEDAR